MKTLFSTLTLLCALVLAVPAHAMKCDPRDTTCIGSPDGVPCGDLHQVCCNINGYDYDCHNVDNACNPSSNSCVPYIVPCTAKCYYQSQFRWPTFSAFGWSTPSQLSTIALQKCLTSFPGSLYISYSCSY
jgi:hypothetical protein